MSSLYRRPGVVADRPMRTLEAFLLEVVRPRMRRTFFPWPRPSERWLYWHVRGMDCVLHGLHTVQSALTAEYLRGAFCESSIAATGYIEATRGNRVAQQFRELVELSLKKARLEQAA